MRLGETNIGNIIVEEDMRPVGIVTDRDMALRVVARDRNPDDVSSEKVLTPDPVTINLERGLIDVTQTMREHAVRRLPVVDGDKLVGVITLDDVLRLLSRGLNDLGEVFEAESTAY